MSTAAQDVADEALRRGILKERLILADSVRAEIEGDVLVLKFADEGEIRLEQPVAPVYPPAVPIAPPGLKSTGGFTFRPKQDVTVADVGVRFAAYAIVPTPEQAALLHASRATFQQAAFELSQILAPGREKSLAFMALEEASFWASAAIVRATSVSKK